MLSDCLLHVQAQEFAKVMQPLFRQIARCLNSSHFQVSRIMLPALPPLSTLDTLRIPVHALGE